VLVTVSDKKIPVSTNGTTVDYYTADIITANDYYPGGMLMPGRKYQTGNAFYRYGFNGKEKVSEINNSDYDYGARIYDSRLGRWFATDRQAKAWINPYEYCSNSPTNLIDPDGNDEIHFFFYVTTYSINGMPKGSTTASVIISKDNGPLRFVHHRINETFDSKGDRKVTHKPTEFYPGIKGSKSGLTYWTFFGIKDVKDEDFATLQKYLDIFPELKNLANYEEMRAKGSNPSQAAKNAQFWSSAIAANEFRHKQDDEIETFYGLVKGVLLIAGWEYALAKLPATLEAAAGSALAAREAATEGAHFLIRHGAETSLSSQYMRAISGLTPDGVVLDAVNSSKFLSNQLQLEAIKRVEAEFLATGSSNITIDMGKVVGEGFLKGGGVGSYRTSQSVQAFFKDGKLLTIFPKLVP
jgi:RHS repeat-associated protein